MRDLPATVRRSLFALMLCLLGTLGPQVPRLYAAGAQLSLTPPANLPHGTEQVSGSGFPPLAPVALSVTTSAGTTRIGSLQADDLGSIAGSVTLPLSLDTGATNTVTAQAEGDPLAASAPLIGLTLGPSIAASTQSARLGDQLTIRGVGFAPLEPVTISVGGAPVTIVPATAPPPITSSSGTLLASFQVPIGAQAGASTITVIGSATGAGQTDLATMPLEIVGPQGLVASPNPATPGRTLLITGSGYAAGEEVDITLTYTDTAVGAAAPLGTAVVADAAGGIDGQITLPLTAQGRSAAVLSARGQRSALIQSAMIAIAPSAAIDVTPDSAQPGSTVQLSGKDFAPGERLLSSTPLFSRPLGFAADTTGSFSATVTLRDRLPAGIYSLGVSGISGDAATTKITIPRPPAPRLATSLQVVAPGQDVSLQGSAFLPGEPVQLSFNSTVITPTAGPLAADATGAFSTPVQIPVVPASGPGVLSAQGLHTGAVGSIRLAVQLPITSSLYFAEGFTGQGPAVRFDESFALLNTNPLTATGEIEYTLEGGSVNSVPIVIAAHARLNEDVLRDVGANHPVSAVVRTDRTISATRVISRTAILTGAALQTSISNAQQTLSPYWYFAEGYTGASFQEYLALFNPGAASATVSVQPIGAAGSAPLPSIDRQVPPHTRVTVNIRALLPGRSLGLLVQSDQPVAAERTLYWGDGGGSGKFGAAVTGGTAQPAALWTFPYLSTVGGDQAFITITNPTTVAAHAHLTSYRADGRVPDGSDVVIEPSSRATVPFPAAGSQGIVVGLTISTDVPVVSEEAQYFAGSPNVGSHTGSVVQGVPQAATSWVFPLIEGPTTRRWYVLNSGSMAARITAEIYGPNAQPAVETFTVGPDKLATLTPRALLNATSIVWISSSPVVIAQFGRGGQYYGQGALIKGIAAG